MDWLRLPLCVLRSYIDVLPRVRAERALEGVSVALIGAGNMEQRHAERAINDWQREANGPMERAPQLTEEERRELYRQSGFFDVEVVD